MSYPDSKVHGANMEPSLVLSAPDGPMLAPWTLLLGYSEIARFMGPTWGPPGSCWPQMAPYWPHELCCQGVYSFGWGSRMITLMQAKWPLRLNGRYKTTTQHYSNVTMSAKASQITGMSTVSSIVCSDPHQRKHQSFTSLWGESGGERWISLTKGQ